jgi:hypothetical protein
MGLHAALPVYLYVIMLVGRAIILCERDIDRIRLSGLLVDRLGRCVLCHRPSYAMGVKRETLITIHAKIFNRQYSSHQHPTHILYIQCNVTYLIGCN